MGSQGHEGKSIRVFTTRPDTIFGISFCVLSPEHPLVEQIATPARREAVDAYREKAGRMTEIERMAKTREMDGVFTGAHAVNPINGEAVPVWIADYVLMGYGTGAIMAVPAHDPRAQCFPSPSGLPLPAVLRPGAGSPVQEGAPLRATAGAARVPGTVTALKKAGVPL